MIQVTIGQYFPGKSVVHALDPRMKIILTLVYVAMLFTATNPFALLAGAAFLALVYILSRIPIKLILRSLKPILPIIIFTAVLNLFFVQGPPIFQFYFIKITSAGLMTAFLMSLRIICLIAGTSLLTYTTSPILLTDAIERLLKPLKLLHAPVHELAMMMTIALRFIPTLIEETDKIMNAQKARGADWENGSVMSRAKAMIPILIPLFVSAFRRADELALAMECRCYAGGEHRTRMRQLKLQSRDFMALLFIAAFFAGVIVLNVFA